MNKEINQLIDYGIQNNMLRSEDIFYSANCLLDLFHLDCFERKYYEPVSIYEILDSMIDYAIEKKMILDSITEKDLLDTKIMNCIMPRPSEVVCKFNELYQKSPVAATDYFYKLSMDSNYIRMSRIDKNIKFHHYYKYGDIQITINLSKPEKDPKAIENAKSLPSSGYPACLLCKENVGFAGNMNHPARQTHRIIPLNLNGQMYNMQYSPYVYYNEHCIVFNEEHTPMVINEETCKHLVSFIKQFPHYMLGSNADLPIVGGSILTHDHYQGGRHHFPMEDAEIIKEFRLSYFPSVKVEMLYWPLSTLRLTSKNEDEILSLANLILLKWRGYSDPEFDILSSTNGVLHNTITPIARMKDGFIQLDMVLRNNRTTPEYPMGIFHPHQEHHHIKKENIGLIEVMGLAVLPGRLKKELEEIKACLLGDDIDAYPDLEAHKNWFEYLKNGSFDQNNIDDYLEKEVTKKFVSVLENAGVYKMNDEGMKGFTRFVDSLGKSK